jgi:hypothetical protein
MNLEHETKKQAKKGLVSQFIGVLSALLPVLAVLGINFEWFNQSFIDSLEVFISALVLFGINAFTIIKNHYSGKKAQTQYKELRRRGLK